MSHTPGPWHIAGKGTIRAGDGWIANIHWRNREANARLVASAPDLLEALEAMMHAHRADMEFDPDPDTGSGKAWDLAEAALAKTRPAED